MEIQYDLQTPWPTDAANPEDLEAVDWTQSGEIPFLPVAGMLIDCGDGDYREVRDVYWNAAEPSKVQVFFEDETPRALAYWTNGGWKTEDLIQRPTTPKRTKTSPPNLRSSVSPKGSKEVV